MTTIKMNFSEDLITLLKARNTLLWIVSREEVQAERLIVSAAGSAKYPVYTWDCVKGICDTSGNSVEPNGDPAAALRFVSETKERI